ncbi:MAG: hypothetical protein J6W13_06235 [Salinivirgaceae bacterium]|nr:hypothetical protein [Salinivirgaceae bacterium]
MKTIVHSLILLAVVSVMATSCSNKSSKNHAKDIDLSIQNIDSLSQTIKFSNTLFSLPSPYQLTMLVRNTGVSFNSNLLNSLENNQNYTSSFDKCVNLGVYGADLAYMSIYEQAPLIVSLFSVIKSLSNDLDLTSAFSKELVERIENNVNDKDSLMNIVSGAYRDMDVYMKETQRQREGALVLAGGWIESMYILSQLTVETKSDALAQRIGESRQPLDNLIKILSPYYHDAPEIEGLLDELVELADIFAGVESQYTYVVPEIDAEKKMTIVKSVTKITISDDVLSEIAEKVSVIRESIINRV